VFIHFIAHSELVALEKEYESTLCTPFQAAARGKVAVSVCILIELYTVECNVVALGIYDTFWLLEFGLKW